MAEEAEDKIENGVEKCECGMPLTDKTRCSCEKNKCFYCCNCPETCKCGCQEKKKASA